MPRRVSRWRGDTEKTSRESRVLMTMGRMAVMM